MRFADALSFALLAALWGGSFLLMRVAAPEFGPLALMLMRCVIGALVLLPVCVARRAVPDMVRAAGPIAVLGIINSALPFVLFGYAALSVPSGMIAVLNATAPFFGVIVAWLWLRERAGAAQLAGLIVGFAGVVILLDGGGQLAGASGPGLSAGVLAALLAALCYGIGASYLRRRLGGVNPLAAATGSQVGAALALLVPGVIAWPESAPSTQAWVATALLGILATGLAYLLYFRLVRNLGPGRAITVTFAIPVFGLFWGAVLLGETVNGQMLTGALLVIVGCAFTTGFIRRRTVTRSAAVSSD